MTPTTVAEYIELARELPAVAAVLNPVAEETARRNAAAFDEVAIRQRTMVDVTDRDPSVEVLGRRIAFPVMITPSSGHRRYHPDGELATVRAAGAAGILFGGAMVTDCSLEEIAAAATGPIWFQTYVLKNRDITANTVKRAERAGYDGIVLTVDVPSQRLPEFGPDHRADPELVPWGNFRGLDMPGVPDVTTWPACRSAPFTWADVAWFRSLTRLPIVFKGIATAEDAALCVQHGIDAIVVSNHGGFALAGAEASLHRLPEVVAAVDGKLEVYLDGGVRRGSDVLKAVALGARAVLIGRPVVASLAVGGQEGLEHMLSILRAELDAAMTHAGVTSLRDVSRAVVTPVGRGFAWQTAGDRLVELARLVDDGYVTREEFAHIKERLIG